MAQVLGKGKIVISADTKKMNAGLKNMGMKIKNFANQATKMLGGMVIGAALFKGVQGAKSLGEALRQIHTLDASADMKMIREESMRMSKVLGIDATKAAEGFYQALSASGGKSKEFTKTLFEQGVALSQIAAASGQVVSVSDAIKALGGTVNAFGGGVEDIRTTASALFNAVKNGITDIGALAGSLSKTTGIASAFGMKIGELSAMLSIMTAKGMDTAAATTGLNAIMSELAKGATEAGQAFEMLNLGTLDEALKTNTLIEILQKLKESAGGSDAALFKMFGNIRGSKATLSLLGGNLQKNIDLVNKFKDGTNDAGAALKRFKEDPATKFNSQMQTIQQVVMNIVEALGGFGNVVAITAGILSAKMGAYIAFGIAKAFALNPIAGLAAAAAGGIVAGIAGGIAAQNIGGGSTTGQTSVPTTGRKDSQTINIFSSTDELGNHTTKVQQGRNGSKIGNVDSTT